MLREGHHEEQPDKSVFFSYLLLLHDHFLVPLAPVMKVYEVPYYCKYKKMFICTTIVFQINTNDLKTTSE